MSLGGLTLCFLHLLLSYYQPLRNNLSFISSTIQYCIYARRRQFVTPLLHVQLLVEFCLTDGDPIVKTLSSPRLQSLLAYLLLHRHAPQSRNHLAFLFWPDSTEAQAQTNLRQLLHHLRHALPEADHFLSADNKTLQWRP